ncbi:YL1 nuclear protein-domain-containing protein, partial [Clohesyomyces aquaticus]
VDDRLASDHDGPLSASESGPDRDDEPAELMVVSRARRSNAGNRMSTLLAKTAEEEEWGEEWEDAPNEEEFVGDEANDQDDFNLDSSSSEDDDEGAEDDAGEKELRKAERQDRVKHRRPATNPFAARLAAARKKVKLDVPLAPSQTTAAPRPKKKSERASWIPTPEDGPVRTSSRRQTVANKEHTLAKLKEKDQKRGDTLAMMKAAEERKAKDKPKPMTQAERLAEAARVERQNSKSLHRWEEAEEQRAAERQAKLDAMKNRQIEGPFIRYYSGPAIWVDDKIKYTGKDAPKIEDLEEKLNKDIPAGSSSQDPPMDTTEQSQSAPPGQTQPNQASSQPPQIPGQSQSMGSHSMSYPSSIMFAPPQNPDSFLFGIEQYAAMPHEAPHHNISQPPSQPRQQQQAQQAPTQQQPSQAISITPPQPPPPFSPPSSTQPTFSPHFSTQPTSPFSQPHPSLADASLTNSNSQTPINAQSLLATFQPPPQSLGSQQHPQPQQQQQPQAPPAPPPPPRRKTIRRAARTLITLLSFPSLSNPPSIAPPKPRSTTSILKDRDRASLIALSRILFNWTLEDATTYINAMLSAPKTAKAREKEMLAARGKKELCAVSNSVARYRDPGTGICYRDARAFGVIKGVVGGEIRWCGGLGCYVGG